MADVDTALVEQILEVSQRQRVLHVHHTAKRITSGDELKQRNGLGGFARNLRFIAPGYLWRRDCHIALTAPFEAYIRLVHVPTEPVGDEHKAHSDRRRTCQVWRSTERGMRGSRRGICTYPSEAVVR